MHENIHRRTRELVWSLTGLSDYNSLVHVSRLVEQLVEFSLTGDTRFEHFPDGRNQNVTPVTFVGKSLIFQRFDSAFIDKKLTFESGVCSVSGTSYQLHYDYDS